MRGGDARLPQDRLVDTDPEDPSQELDDLGGFDIAPVSIEAQSTAEASEDFDVASAENMLGDSEPLDEDEEAEGDTGDLYGVRIPRAGDPDLAAPDDPAGFDGAERGENLFEAIAEHATTMGPADEAEVVIVEDNEGHHPTERDRPVADKGSSGPGGR